MRFFLGMTFLTSLIIGASYWYAKTANICPVPIYYSLGEIDERFDITAEELKAVAAKAEAVWEDLTPEELFVYDERSDFKINLIFDERQQLARTEDDWRASLDKQESTNQSQMDFIENLSADYERQETAYKVKRDEYEEKLSSYNAKVDNYNKQGGAPPNVYADLQEEQKALNSLATSLSASEKKLNALADQINDLGESTNEKINAYNQEVLKYNDLFGSRDIFTQGDFKRERINIYKFSSESELTRVLSHEFGHSLGLPHVEGEGSVMYYLTTDTDSLLVSETDRQALMTVCGDNNTLSSQVRRVIREVLLYL